MCRPTVAERFYRSASWSNQTQLVVAALLVLTVAVVVGGLTGDHDSAAPLPLIGATPPDSTPSAAAAVTTEAPSTTESPARTPPTTPVTTSAAVTTTTVGTYVEPPLPLPALDVAAARDLLEALPVAEEYPEGYDRDLFAVWTDLEGDGCDPRAEVLIAESLTPAQVDPFGCFVVSGDWLSAYDGQVFDSPADLDVDHLVPLQEAWRSGAWSWSVQQRIDYANDVSDPRTLAAVSSSSNRSKGDRDPAQWLPVDAAQCAYVVDWIAVKARWAMTADTREFVALAALLERCGA